jgi:hypothetical protein
MSSFFSCLTVVEVVDELAEVVLDVSYIDCGSPNDLCVVHTAALITNVHSHVLVLLKLIDLQQTKSHLICC